MKTLDDVLDAAASDIRRAAEQLPIPSTFPDDDVRFGRRDGSRTRLLIGVAAVVLLVGGIVWIQGRATEPPSVTPAETTSTTLVLFDAASPPLELTRTPAGYAMGVQIIRPVADGNYRSAVFVKRDAEGAIIGKVFARVGDFGLVGYGYGEPVTAPPNLPVAATGQIFIEEQARVIHVQFLTGNLRNLELTSNHLDATTDPQTSGDMLAIVSTLDLTTPDISVVGSLPQGWELAVSGLEPVFVTQEFFQAFEVDVPEGGNKILISNWMTDAPGMPYWEMDETLDPINVRGHDGFVSTVIYPPSDPNAPPPPNAGGSTSLIWQEAPGHWVTLRGDDMNVGQVLALADQLTPAVSGQWGEITLATGTTTTAGPEIPAQPTVGDLFDFSVHKSEFFLVLEVAEWNQSLACMRAQGFTVPSIEPRPVARVVLYGMPEGEDPSGGFRLTPPPGFVEPDPTPELTTQEAIVFNGPNDSETRALSLPSGETSITLRGGCVGDTQRRLYGSAETYFEAMTLFFTLQDEEMPMLQRAASSPDMSTLNEEWSACMASAGFMFTRPQDAWNFEWPDETTPVEIAAATADVTCKSAVDFSNRGDAITREIAATEPQEITDMLERWFELSSEIMARANEA